MFLGRVVGDGEPLWLAEDRAWALALLEAEADQCPDCHQPWSQSSDPTTEGRWDVDVVRCYACAMTAARVTAFQENRGDTRGLHVQVSPRRR